MSRNIDASGSGDSRDAPNAARIAYADALALGRSHHEARHAYAVALRQHGATDPPRDAPIYRTTKRPR
jgi:hypothetical protein